MLVIDMQCYYASRIAGIDAIVPRIQQLCDTLRGRGATVVWLMNTLERDGVDLWPAYHAGFFDAAAALEHRRGLASGSAGHALIDGLQRDARDPVIEKTRFSAFAPGSSVLADVLAARQIDNLLITGVATNVCCESTARDAMMRDYRVAIVSDATAAVTPEDHVNGLSTLASCFADVVTSTEVVARLIQG
ncbi:isochorismatase family cysteine hydrolase [Variovorax sp. PAMC 28711]|uniref:isochorismatase family cysteine hydrolase n=1 Tax=Variovorax sp. PAMC 28711 TaxID=1795631 RepID=UPI00143B1DAD|nr:isochorismatase family cysteine hydrolase [Variovorax sp. PAMC 28711]